MQNKHYFFRVVAIAGLLLTIIFSSCKKDDYYTKEDASLVFSQSLITFDTVFTTIGTITKKFTVYNPHKNTIKTNIALVGGSTSSFSVNVDGVSGTSFTDVEIPAKDSIFIFVKANINPNNSNGPILHVDELSFFTNGNRQKVELLACAEDAKFIIADRQVGSIQYKIVAGENKTVTWYKDTAYVIYGYAVIDSTAKLIIEAGTQIYIHKGGGLWVYVDGCLEVNGTKDEPVVFQGDRRSSAPKYDYAQWDRIWINEGSRDNKINYAIIKNAYIGIQAEIWHQDMGNKLILSNSIIKCSEGIGFLARSYHVEAYNNVISDCGNYCLALTQGGNYSFINNTFYNQYAYSRSTSAVFFSDYYDPGGDNEIIVGDFNCNFINNIVYGNSTKEFTYAHKYPKITTFSTQIENCLIRTETKYLSGLTYSDCILNENPLVNNIKEYDFSLQNDSPCKGKGKSTSVTEDITGISRNNPPSIGAYE